MVLKSIINLKIILLIVIIIIIKVLTTESIIVRRILAELLGEQHGKEKTLNMK